MNTTVLFKMINLVSLGIDLFVKSYSILFLQVKDTLDCITSAAIAAPPPAATLSYGEGSNSILDGNPRYGVNENLSSLRFVNQG